MWQCRQFEIILILRTFRCTDGTACMRYSNNSYWLHFLQQPLDLALHLPASLQHGSLGPCRQFEDILHSLPLLIVASSQDAADQAFQDVHDGSEGQMQHLQCLLLNVSPSATRPSSVRSSPLPVRNSSPLSASLAAPPNSWGTSYALAKGPLNHAPRSPGTAIMAVEDGASGFISAQAHGVPGGPATDDSERLVHALQWLAQHRPQPPAMQVDAPPRSALVPCNACH